MSAKERSPASALSCQGMWSRGGTAPCSAPHYHPPFSCNLQPKFIRAIQTPSYVGGALANLANDLPPPPEGDDNRQILTQVANHLLSLAHQKGVLCHLTASMSDATRGVTSTLRTFDNMKKS